MILDDRHGPYIGLAERTLRDSGFDGATPTTSRERRGAVAYTAGSKVLVFSSSVCPRGGFDALRIPLPNDRIALSGKEKGELAVDQAVAHLRPCHACRIHHKTDAHRLRAAFDAHVLSVLPLPSLYTGAHLPTRLFAGCGLTSRALPPTDLGAAEGDTRKSVGGHSGHERRREAHSRSPQRAPLGRWRCRRGSRCVDACLVGR
jgi:hypothetical protein